MKLTVLTVFVLLVAVHGAPNMDQEYQDSLGNQLDDYENRQTETANNLEGLDDTYTESGKHGEDEGTENNHHEYEEDDGSAHTGYAEDETTNQANEDERAEEESSNNKAEDGSESSEESSEEDQKKGHKHWFSRHHKQKHDSSDGEKGDSKTKKITHKVHDIVRAQVLKKASIYSGTAVKEDEGGALVKKVGSMVRDATIRRMAPQMFSKPLHGAVNLLKSHFDTMDNEKRGTMATRDLDTYYQRALARDIGFRVADRVINTMSTLVGGALAAGTIHQLHKTPHDDVNHVDELGAEQLAEFAEELNKELNEEPGETVQTANQVRSLHSKKEEHKKKKEHKQKEEHEKKDHFWSKSKHEKGEVEKKDKHHKKDAHEKKDKHHLWSLKKKHNKGVSDEDDDDDDSEHELENQQPLKHHID